VLHLAAGLPELARQHLDAALLINREVGDRRIEGIVLAHLAALDSREGRMAEARERVLRALELHRQSRNRRFEGVAETVFAVIEAQLGDPVSAAAALARGEALVREVGWPVLLARWWVARAQVAWLGGDADAAREALGQAAASGRPEVTREIAELRQRWGSNEGAG
jgi:tetratricopeptide (TPR) repeat protein